MKSTPTQTPDSAIGEPELAWRGNVAVVPRISRLPGFTRPTWARLITGFVLSCATGAVVAFAVIRAGGWRTGTGWDLEVLHRAHVSLPRWLDLLLLSIPWLGTNITIFAVLIPLGVWLKRRGREDIVAQLAAAAVGSYILDVLMKAVFDRPRPALWPHRGEYTWASYPSGHVIAVMSVLLFAAYLVHREKGVTWAFVVWLAVCVAMVYSRIYLGVHWPSDVLGGLLIGVVWFLTVRLTFRRPDWRAA